MYNPTKKDTICWSCKCATNPEGTTCSWSADGVPVKGWVAEKGYIFRIPIKETGEHIIAQAYTVISCPLYERDSKYLTVEDVIDRLTAYFKCRRHSIYASFEKKIKQYEKETGEMLPVWIKYYLKDKKSGLNKASSVHKKG